MDPQIFTTMKHQMLDGKEKEIANRSSPLFKVIFISFLYALFTFSANSPCTPKIHSILYLSRNHLRSTMGIINL